MKTLDELVHDMKEEILDLVQAGVIPDNVSSFGNLHDHTDANCLAKMCDDDGPLDELIAHFGGRDDGTDGLPDALMDYLNSAQDAVHDWIVNGGIAHGIGIRKA